MRVWNGLSHPDFKKKKKKQHRMNRHFSVGTLVLTVWVMALIWSPFRAYLSMCQHSCFTPQVSLEWLSSQCLWWDGLESTSWLSRQPVAYTPVVIPAITRVHSSPHSPGHILLVGPVGFSEGPAELKELSRNTADLRIDVTILSSKIKSQRNLNKIHSMALLKGTKVQCG